MFNKCFDSTAPDFDVSGFLYLEIGATELNERLKPFPCYSRAIAVQLPGQIHFSSTRQMFD